MHTRNGAASSALFLFHQCPSLDSALQRYREWEQDLDRYGIGQIALSFDGESWLVLVSHDLIEVALPF